jgi:hypothetical protein
MQLAAMGLLFWRGRIGSNFCTSQRRAREHGNVWAYFPPFGNIIPIGNDMKGTSWIA